MSLISREQPLDARLLEQPRTVMTLIAMYEGLARSCDQMLTSASQSPLDAATQAHLERYLRLYEKRVGVDVTRRNELRQKADERIQQEALSIGGSKGGT